MWYEEAVFYQIYPLGFCDAINYEPDPGTTLVEDDGTAPIARVKDWVPHLKKLGVTAVYFSPVFQSDYHGYETRDYFTIDRRLGTNEDFADVVATMHDAGIRVVLDGVFNHVGRGFWAFQDVLEKKWGSPYKDWFHISFDGDTDYHDGFWYEGWEGYHNMVKLNLQNSAVREHLFSAIRAWVQDFDIDGLRLDVSYCLPDWFLEELRRETDALKPDFFLLGEVLHGDYNRIMSPTRCHSVTNYECYKGLYSAFNSMNLFEIAHSLQRQFGTDPWCLYTGKHLVNFADNHDVDRLASTLTNPAHLPLLYGLLFAMPGIPMVYYGSEWGATGRKHDGTDADIRACYEEPVENELFAQIARYADCKNTLSLNPQRQKAASALNFGGYRQVFLTNRQFVFERSFEETRVLVAINADATPFTATLDAGAPSADDLLTGTAVDLSGGTLELPPNSVQYLLLHSEN